MKALVIRPKEDENPKEGQLEVKVDNFWAEK